MAEPTVHDYGERWDASDVAALVERRAQGQTMGDIAAGMGRTRAAVRSKLSRLRAAGVDVSKGAGGSRGTRRSS